MLTEREFKQIKTAIETAWSYNINGDHCMPKDNVLVILQNYLEEDEVGETIQERDL